MIKDKKGFNPYSIGIWIFVGLVMIATIYTIMIAANAGIDKETAYGGKGYDDVDKNYNKYKASEDKFDKSYTIKALYKDNSIEAYISDIAGTKATDFKVTLFITRPATDKDDMGYKKFELQDGIYKSEKLTFPKKGRWQARIFAKKDELAKEVKLTFVVE